MRIASGVARHFAESIDNKDRSTDKRGIQQTPWYCAITVDFSVASCDFVIDTQNGPESISAHLIVKTYSDRKIKSDKSLVEDLNKYYAQKEYRKVESITKELIRRNPFTESVHVMRVLALNKLGLDASKEL